VAVPRAAHAQEAGAAIYVHGDTDHTTVVAPRLRVQVPITETTKATAIYAVDVWTSASIDIMTSASRVPVTEQRDEIDLSVDHELTDVTLTLGYRYSTEPDYVSHSVSGGFGYDFADNNSTLAVGFSGSTDTVGRAGDPKFSEGVGTLGGRLSFTQVLSSTTVGQAIYELTRAAGYQASPYRFVGIGGDGQCTSSTGDMTGTATLCVPEVAPHTRLRHALGVELRQALGKETALQGGYRFYTDSWGVMSHTARLELAWSPNADTVLAGRYRLYTQGAANHYKNIYDSLEDYVTRDKELSPLSSHRLALEADHDWHFRDNRTLTAILTLAPILYFYSDFAPLKQMTAFEVSAAVVFVP
jgi:hypothetical protein